jgi:hypothetical protein
MKRAIGVVVLLLIFIPFAFSIDIGDFDAVADFSVTIKTLNQLDEATAREYGLMHRFLLLDGTVTNIMVLDATPENYLVQLELVSGEWIGLDDVRSYSCWVLFSGPKFAEVFPTRVPRNPPPGVVKANDPILIVALPLQTVEIAPGEMAWVLEGVHVRLLQ